MIQNPIWMIWYPKYTFLNPPPNLLSKNLQNLPWMVPWYTFKNPPPNLRKQHLQNLPWMIPLMLTSAMGNLSMLASPATETWRPGITALNVMNLFSASSVILVKVIPIVWENLVLTWRARLRLIELTITAIPHKLLLFRDASTVWCMPANAICPVYHVICPAATK